MSSSIPASDPYPRSCPSVRIWVRTALTEWYPCLCHTESSSADARLVASVLAVRPSLGSETRTSCRDLVGLVNQAIEAIPAPNAGGDRYRIRLSPDLDTPWRPKHKAPVRPLLVVVPHILIKDAFKRPSTPISIQSRHSCRTVRTHRSATALAFGA